MQTSYHIYKSWKMANQNSALLSKFAFAGIALLVMLTACQKEAALTPSPAHPFYSLPQGNHPYDQSIGQFYQNYHSYILYKFDSAAYNYNVTGPLNPELAMQVADTNDITAALDFLHAQWLDLYPTAFLQQTLPYKILLSSQISIADIYNGQIDYYSYYGASAGLNYVAFGLANDSLKTLTTPQIDSTRGVLNQAFWQQAVQSNMIERPASFDSLTNYAYVNQTNLNQNGMFYYHPYGNNGVVDFLDYIQVITSTDSTTMSNTWLSPSVDVNGLYTAKYNMILNYYIQHYGVNLQAIGNK